MGDPYRTNAKPIEIARDRRKEKAAGLVLAGVAMGAGFTFIMTGSSSSVRTAPAVVVTEPPDITAPPPVSSAPYGTQVESVVAAHRIALRGECWSRGTATAHLRDASVKVTLSLQANGTVAKAQATSATPHAERLLACVEEQTQAWRFPPPPEDTRTIVIPFQFKRE